MDKPRAPRNRTMILTEEDRLRYADVGAPLDHPCTAEELRDRVICQDLFEALPYLPREFADLIVIDPPYNLSKDFGAVSFREVSDEDYEEYVESWLPRVLECLKPDGSVYVCCDWRSSSAVYRVLSRHAVVKNRITWQREKGRGAGSNWKNGMEDIWYAVKDAKHYYFDLEAVKVKRRVRAPYRKDGQPKDWQESEQGRYRLTCPSNFWDDITVPYWSMPENTDHPTQKPEKLIAKLILASCPEGGVVFDPFGGSGTTAVTAKKLRRSYAMIEMDKDYVMLTAKRMERAEENPEIQGLRGGIFLDRNFPG